MPQRKQLTWAELRVGLFALVGLFIIAAGIFYVTGAGALAPKYQLRTYLPEVEGLTIGAPVRLDGLEIGNVDAIEMNPEARGNRVRNIRITMRIIRKYQDEIRADSSASLITEGLLGNRYVSIKRGFTGKRIEAGGEVPGREEAAVKAIVERGADLVQNLSTLSGEVREIVTGVQRGRGTLGKLLTDEEIYNRAKSVVTRADEFVTSAQAGKGTIGKLVASDELYQKAHSAVTRADTVLADIQAKKGTLGKLVYDPTVHDNAKQFLDRGNAFIADVRAGKGSLGKLATDESLYQTWRDVGDNLESATARLNNSQGTAGKFFSDPQFYDNITGLSGDLRLLISEFRQNPKKFLRVKFSIF
jgi:phospholipid/cholesterol/gamma-HCH transport system substrate-binding protein